MVALRPSVVSYAGVMAEAIANILLLEPRAVASVPRWSDAMVVAVVNFIGGILSSAAAAGIAVCFL